MSALLAFTTYPDHAGALKLARQLVEEKLVACVNILPQITSVYSWEGSIHEDSEILLLLKTQASLAARLEQRLVELHPYDTPEFVVVTADSVNARYLKWIEASTIA